MSSALAAALRLSALVALSAVALSAVAPTAAEVTPEPINGVWDAYPASLIEVCPHIPRREIDFDKLNGRWFVMEKGGFSRPDNLCEIDFHVVQEQNLTLRISLRAFQDGNLTEQYNSVWIMSDENVWREYGESQMYLFVGRASGPRILLLCAVDAVGRDTSDGYSLAMVRDPRLVKQRELVAARLPGNVVPTDRAHCARGQ